MEGPESVVDSNVVVLQTEVYDNDGDDDDNGVSVGTQTEFQDDGPLNVNKQTSVPEAVDLTPSYKNFNKNSELFVNVRNSGFQVPAAPEKKKRCPRKRVRFATENEVTDFNHSQNSVSVITVYDRYKPDPAKFLVIGSPNIFVNVQEFKSAVYVSIHMFTYDQVLLNWVPCRIGLYLASEEWQKLCHPRMIGLIADAIDQEINFRAPIVKRYLRDELAQPTSYPEQISGDSFHHRHDISFNKSVVVCRDYSPKREVTISLIQFERSGLWEAPKPQKGIHLSVDAWNKLCGFSQEVTRRVKLVENKNG